MMGRPVPAPWRGSLAAPGPAEDGGRTARPRTGGDGMTRDWRSGGRWRKSSRSEQTQCVFVRGDLGAVRDSKDPGGPTLPVSREGFAALVRAVGA